MHYKFYFTYLRTYLLSLLSASFKLTESLLRVLNF